MKDEMRKEKKKKKVKDETTRSIYSQWQEYQNQGIFILFYITGV